MCTLSYSPQESVSSAAIAASLGKLTAPWRNKQTIQRNKGRGFGSGEGTTIIIREMYAYLSTYLNRYVI